eukprot:3889424-Pleurochrysis_carterae.AAC.1
MTPHHAAVSARSPHLPASLTQLFSPIAVASLSPPPTPRPPFRFPRSRPYLEPPPVCACHRRLLRRLTTRRASSRFCVRSAKLLLS